MIENIIAAFVAGSLLTLLVALWPKIKCSISRFRVLSEFEIDKAGIIGIWENRFANGAESVLIERLRQAKGEILVVGVASPTLFRPSSRIYLESLKEKIEDPTFTFKVLLLDPKGINAEERAKIEKGRNTIRDIEGTIEFLKEIPTKATIVVHTYDFPPLLFLVMTNECMFAEQYHFGQPRVDLGCAGGQVPLLLFKYESDTYRVLKQHFEYVWDEKSEEIIKRP